MRSRITHAISTSGPTTWRDALDPDESASTSTAILRNLQNENAAEIQKAVPRKRRVETEPPNLRIYPQKFVSSVQDRMLKAAQPPVISSKSAVVGESYFIIQINGLELAERAGFEPTVACAKPLKQRRFSPTPYQRKGMYTCGHKLRTPSQLPVRLPGRMP